MKSLRIEITVQLDELAGFVKYCEKHKIIIEHSRDGEATKRIKKRKVFLDPKIKASIRHAFKTSKVTLEEVASAYDISLSTARALKRSATET